MQGLIIGAVAFVAGAGMAVATAFGVVNSATSATFEPPNDDVLQYGSTK